MKSNSTTIIDEFCGKEENTRALFQLTQEENGKYSIKRGETTLLIYPEEGRARAGFNMLRERRENERD